MSVVTIHLTPDEEARAAGLVAEGRYESVEEALRDGLRRLDEEARRRDEMCDEDGVEPPLTIEELREELRKGEESGFVEVTDLDAFFAEIAAEVDAKLETEARLEAEARGAA